MSTSPLTRIRNIYNEYPKQFWVLVLGVFIDRLGGALMFPFFTLYVTQKFNVGMMEVGLLFAVFSISNVVGSMFGGALADRLGRKGMMIFGLVASALTSLLMGLVGSIELFFGTALIVGLFASAGGPASQAMVADLLPEEKRSQGFGIIRVVFNLAVTIGPAIGGLLASQNYMLLFICDAVTSTIRSPPSSWPWRYGRPNPKPPRASPRRRWPRRSAAIWMFCGMPPTSCSWELAF